MSGAHKPAVNVSREQLRDGQWSTGWRMLAEETPVAIVVNASTEAVMMASPSDIEPFAIGFALTEGLISGLDDIDRLSIEEGALGVEARLWLRDGAAEAHARRRRLRAGPVGCGLCGIESIEAALRPLPKVESMVQISARAILAAMTALSQRQDLNALTHSAHAAAFFTPNDGLVAIREDIGRHNALDKLCGALALEQRSAGAGAVLMTSRISVELVQKCAIIGAPIIAAVSAPTALAVRLAEQANITVCAIVRHNGFEVFTHERRISRDEH